MQITSQLDYFIILIPAIENNIISYLPILLVASDGAIYGANAVLVQVIDSFRSWFWMHLWMGLLVECGIYILLRLNLNYQYTNIIFVNAAWVSRSSWAFDSIPYFCFL